ncbi:MAG: tetratricopeptide repeat protein, partial [bacterium]|nr:tetratricopeptide repeat protein [bacterium]
MNSKKLLFIGLLGVALAAGLFLFWWQLGEKKDASFPQATTIPSPQAQKCSQCHRDQFKDWKDSQHARANQVWNKPIEVSTPDGRTQSFHPSMQIGLDPLIQFLIDTGSGKFQALDWAWDPKQEEYFYVFEEERQAGEWGHWQGRGMNWNSQCAACHMTGFHKNYDMATDSYQSTWKEMGISCAQCHGGMKDHPKKLSAAQIADNCASCHSRREELQGGFAPGDPYSDFFRMMLPDHADLFYPDGQVKGEVFEANAFRLSRMAHQGVTCLDCHNPHSGKLTQPVKNNQLCLSCHLSPGLRGAPLISPVAHSHHPPESPGNQCVECHMPANAFMVRDLRRDHGFTVPDPRLTVELGIPNACTSCHQDRSPPWAAGWVERWYGKDMNRRTRRRTRLLVRAQQGEAKVWPDLLELAQKEEIPAWRATLLIHLAPWVGEEQVQKYLHQALADPSPLVRAAAVRVLNDGPGNEELLAPLLQDPSRLVRLDVAWGMAIRGAKPPEHDRELLEYLNFHSDQPVGALKQGQLALAQEKFKEAIKWIGQAIAWDPGSAYPQYLMGRALYATGMLEKSRGYFEAAIQLDPENFDYTYHLALLLAELGDLPASRKNLERTVKLNPGFGRAWYNLGLAYLKEEQLDQAIRALELAETLLPQSPGPPQVLADLY